MSYQYTTPVNAVQTTQAQPRPAILADVGVAGNSATALQVLDEFLSMTPQVASSIVDLNAGDVLLTRRVLIKMAGMMKEKEARLGTVYSSVPQTQQAALDEGFFVKEKPEPLVAMASQFITQQTSTPGSLSDLLDAKLVDIPKFSPADDDPILNEAAKATADILLTTEKAVTRKPKSTATLPQNSISVEDVMALLQQENQEAVSSVTDSSDADVDVDEPETELLSQIEITEPLKENMPDDLTSQLPTKVVKQTMRSGQSVACEGNLVVLGDVHTGSEISATGDIVIWGELRGIAHAGANGNENAEIRAMKIEALQLRIGEHIARRPDRIYYHKSQADRPLHPEVARVSEGEIRIFTESFGK